jgi:hypothetical protein
VMPAPNRYGPPYCCRQSRQIAVTRSMSPCAPAQTLKPGCRARSRSLAEELGCHVVGVTESPILGPKGNKEFLICLQKVDSPLLLQS